MRKPINLIVGVGTALNLSFGKAPRHRAGQRVTVCTVDGCMADVLTPRYEGVIVGKKTLQAAGSTRKIDAIEVKNDETGEVQTELTDRLRKLDDGSLVICN